MATHQVIQRIAVVGAGAMGNGIAQVAATAGFDVILRDVTEAAVNEALRTIEKSLGRLVKAGKMTVEVAREVVARIRVVTEFSACVDVDYLIEAIPERLELKKELFAQLDSLCPAHTILATNTSELSVTAIAAATQRPQQVIGMHWFNPPAVMKLIEIVQAVQTSDATLNATKDISHRMGRETVVCKDAQGFITSRALCALLTECYRIAEEGIASYGDIDKAIRLGLNHPMGPFELSDFVGLDVLAHASEGMANAFGDRFLLPQSVVKVVEAGHFGRKRGRGFYDYSQGTAADSQG